MSKDEIIWKAIPAFNGKYQVSNDGQVRSFHGTTPKTLKPRIGKNGYPCVIICITGRRISYYVHKLVALAFLPNPENKCCINHLNGIKHDNRLTNLEWATARENMIHAYRTGLIKDRSSIAPIFDLKTFRLTPTIKQAAKEAGVPYCTCRNILNGSNKSAHHRFIYLGGTTLFKLLLFTAYQKNL